MLIEGGRKLHQSLHSLDPEGRCSGRSDGSETCATERTITDIEEQASERRLIVAGEERAALELLPSLMLAAALGLRIQGWMAQSDMLKEWAAIIAKALTADLIMDQDRLTRAIDTVAAELKLSSDPFSSISVDLDHPALAALLLAAAREDPIRALYARLAKAYEARPFVPDRGGGISGDLFPLGGDEK